MAENYLRTIASLFIPILGSAFLIFIMVDSAIRLGVNRLVGKTMRIAAFSIFGVVIIGLAMLQNPMINAVTLVVVFPVLCHYLCNNKKNYLLFYIGISVVTLLIDFSISCLAQVLILNGILYFKDALYYVLLYVPISKIVSFVFLRLYVALIRKRHHEDISTKHYMANLILPVFSVVFIYSLVYFAQIYIDLFGVGLLLGNMVILLALNLYYPKMIEITEKNNHLQNEIMLYNQQEKLKFQYYEELERKYGESRRIIHDIRNHIIAMEELSKENYNEKALSYTKGIHQMLNDLGQKYYSSNKVLNIILNDKGPLMNSLEIVSDIRIGDVNLNVIEDIDITVIFGNILDNAIEAASESISKEITLRIDQVQDFISIRLTNTLLVQPVKQGGLYKSSKKDHTGIGLKNVKRAVEKYHGDLQFEGRDKLFSVSIMLPVQGGEINGFN